MEALSKQIFNVCVIQKCGCKAFPNCLIFPTAKLWLLLMRLFLQLQNIVRGKNNTLDMAEMLFTDKKKIPFEKFHIGGYEAYFFLLAMSHERHESSTHEVPSSRHLG